MRPTSGTFASLGSLPESRPSLHHLAGVRWGMLAAALLLSAIGLAMVHSASSEMQIDFLPRQAMWVGIGLLLMLIAFSVDYHVLLGLAIPIYAVSLASLALVLVLGHRAGGARSWIGLASLGGQPSEVAKLATVLMLARYLGAPGRRFLSTRQLAVACAIVGAPMLLVVVEPDLGGALTFVPMLAAVLVVAGVRMRILVVAALTVVIGAGALWNWGMHEYQRQRVMTFLNPDRDKLGAGYQVHQGKIAVGSGQFFGKGYMQGTQSQLRFLPARHTDFIFAALAEEWGFVGVAVSLWLFGAYFWSGAQVAMRARDRSGILLVVGLLALFAFHAIYNSAMVVGLLPISGVPLPFLSYGGSFMLLNYTATGIVLGVDFRRFVNR